MNKHDFKYLLIGCLIWLTLAISITLITKRIQESFENNIESLSKKLYSLEESLTKVQKNLKASQSKRKLYSLKVSAYTPRKEECDSTPAITALNKRSRPGKTAAVGTDCLNLLGEEIYIKGLGTFHCTDIKPSEGLDIMVGTVKEAKKIGNKMRTVVLINKGGH